MRALRISAILGLGVSVCVLTGCSTAHSLNAENSTKTSTGTAVLGCHDIIENVHRAVDDAKTGDAEARRIHGFPYLRINRLLAHLGRRFKDRPSGPAFEAWIDRLRAMDAEATRIEINNLPTGEMLALSNNIFGRAANRESIFDAADECAQLRRKMELADPIQRRRLVNVA